MVKPVIEMSASFVIQMLKYLSSLEIDSAWFLKQAGVDPSLIESPDNRMPIHQFYMIQEKALQITGDKNFGLHMGASVEAGSWSILGYIVMNCGTINDALERICRYSEVVGNFIRFHFKKEKHQATLSVDILLIESLNIRHCYEAALSSTAHMLRFVAGGDINFKSVTMLHKAPEDISGHERIFDCPVLFHQKSASIIFDIKSLDIPIVMSNPELLTLFESHAKKLIEKNDSTRLHSRKLSTLLIKWLPDGTPGIDQAANALSMSVRTLQARLSEEDTTFRELLETIRKELAMNYLKDKKCSIDDITYLLGFSEPSVFRKSFKKWTGRTPGSYR